MKTRRIGILFLLLAGVIFCSQQAFCADEPEEDSGNNLSLPVIWSDGVTKVLRGEPGVAVGEGDWWLLWYLADGNEAVCHPIDGDCADAPADAIPVYPQRDPNNEWQAESLLVTPGVDPVVDVTWVDWGDNLEAKDWVERSIIRTETVLYQDISAAPMTGYEMVWLEGEGTTEVWGSTLNTYDSNDATVYTGCGRLTIQQLLIYTYDANHLPLDNAELGLTWNPVTSEWEGAGIGETYFNSGVWEAGEGQDSQVYSAEINVGGKVIYGYNWNTRKQSDGPGYYRITFSMDAGNPAGVPLNTAFNTTQVKLAEEDPDAGSENNNETGGGVAVIDHANNVTYIDVELMPKKGGGGQS